MTIARTARQRQIERIRFNQLLDILEARFQVKYRREISRTMNKLADRLELIGGIDQNVLQDHRKNLQKITMAMYSESVDASAIRQFESIQKNYPEIYEKKDATDVFEQLAITWIFERGATLSNQLTETTEKDVQKILERGVVEGLAIGEITTQIKRRAKITSRRRADLISRTETHTAASWANINSTRTIAEETGLQLSKRWNTTEDERTRVSHREADGQNRDMEEEFTVQGENLDFPGDPDASASNVINCRCFVTYE